MDHPVDGSTLNSKQSLNLSFTKSFLKTMFVSCVDFEEKLPMDMLISRPHLAATCMGTHQV